MCKRIMIGLFAISVVAMWWIEAEAQTCVAWKFVNGRNLCTKMSTKGVLVKVKVNGPQCGPTGDQCLFTAMANSTNDNNIAFCRNTTTNKIRKAECSVLQSFTGSAVGCKPQNNDDDDHDHDHDHDADNDDVNGNKCKVTIVPARTTQCQTCCRVGETCIDVTPVEMDTEVTADASGSENGFAAVLRRLLLEPFGDFAQASGTFPPPEEGCGESPSCTIAEHCTIDPEKIKFNKVRPYQCELLLDGGDF